MSTKASNAAGKKKVFIFAKNTSYSKSNDSGSDDSTMPGRGRQITLDALQELLDRRIYTRSLRNGTGEWLQKTCEVISVHGMAWYTRSQSRKVRLLIICFALFVFIGLPVWTIIQFVDFFTTLQTKTVTETKTGTMLQYPNLTVCHAKFFDTTLLERHNISNELANYMTMVLDPNVRDFVENLRAFDPSIISRLDTLKGELDAILTSQNLQIVELFHKVAVRCNDFIRFCEVHRRFLMPGNEMGGKSCCEQIFNQVPIFTTLGTCYTTNTAIWESYPFTFSNIKVWLDVRTNKSPVYQFNYKGSDAMDRGDVYYAISNQDYPVPALMQSPNKVSKGTVTLIGLSLIETDRRSLRARFCETKPAEFVSKYNIPYTKLNCEILVSQSYIEKCSLNQFYGLYHMNDAPPCKPDDILRLSLTFDDGKYGSKNYRNNSVCTYECFRRDFITKTTSGDVDQTAMKHYVEQTGSTFGNVEDVVVLQLHFTTFDYVRHVMQQESFTDFLSKIGGWFSLAVGASFISFLEIGYFLFEFLFKVIKREIMKSRRASVIAQEKLEKASFSQVESHLSPI